MSTPAGQEQISLLDSLNGEWLKLPLTVMQDVGPAVQTLAGLLRITNRETFMPLSDIAGKARVPLATAKKHMKTLDERGWIKNCGRQHTRRGSPRRTATIKITKKTTDHLEPFGMLPWWVCCCVRCSPRQVGRLPWCAKAVLSVWMARLCRLKAAVERGDDDDVAGQIENMGGEDRFRFSLDWLTAQTGLTRETVVTAKRLLNHQFGIVWWEGTDPRPGVTTETDTLAPNWGFQVIVTPAPQGGCYVAFDKGSENGP